MHKRFMTLMALFLSTGVFAATATDSPVGYWKTIDDVTGKPKSIIKIYENADHRLDGTVVKILTKNPANPTEICKECKDEKHNQPIVGMTILTNLHQEDDEWTGGKILDPATGKYYKCKLHTIANGTQLNIRGYIGVPILGRSQTWVRVNRAN